MKPLCQRDGASCGACCGLYNRIDHTRPALAALLERRTSAIVEAPRSAGSIRAAAARLAADEAATLFAPVRVCPLLGFLDPARSRIGCLAHPLSTGGVDLRDCGAYTSQICETFFCPSHAWLSEDEAALAAEVCDDWYLYGVVVTDVPFLRAALDAVSALTGARVERRHLADPRFRKALRGLLALKEELEPGSEGLYGAFRPGPDAEPVPRLIDDSALGREISPYDAILTCVGADPRSGNDLDALRDEVRRRVDACVDAFHGATAGQQRRYR